MISSIRNKKVKTSFERQQKMAADATEKAAMAEILLESQPGYSFQYVESYTM